MNYAMTVVQSLLCNKVHQRIEHTGIMTDVNVQQILPKKSATLTGQDFTNWLHSRLADLYRFVGKWSIIPPYPSEPTSLIA